MQNNLEMETESFEVKMNNIERNKYNNSQVMINKNFKIEVANRLETIISTFQLIRLRTLLKSRVIIV